MLTLKESPRPWKKHAHKFRLFVEEHRELEMLKRLGRQNHLALPDVELSIGNQLIKGNLVAMELIAQGTETDLLAMAKIIKNTITPHMVRLQDGTEARWRVQARGFVKLDAALHFLTRSNAVAS